MARIDAQERVERHELAIFCRQFGGMLNAGIDLLRILQVLNQQTRNPKLREVLASVEKDVSLGRFLSTALGRFPEVFSPFFLSMVRQGEQEDVLDVALVKLAEHLEHEGEGLGADTGAMVVRSELDFSLQRVWPLLFWMAVGTAIVCVAIAGLWYSTNAGTFPHSSLGPNVLLLVGVLIFLLALIFARFGPVRALLCSFCGKPPEEGDTLIQGRGAAICPACIRRNYQFLTAVQTETPASEPESAGEDQADKPEEEEVEIEEDITEEPDFEIIKDEEDYP